jgi:hypothetical protein
LKKVRSRSLIKNLLKARRLLVVSRAQLILFKINMMSCKRHIKIMKCNLMLFGQVSLTNQVILKLPKPLQANDVIILILMLFVFKVNILMLSRCLYKLMMML